MASSDKTEITAVEDLKEVAACLRSSTAVKMSHLTLRTNIVNNLMTEKDLLDEVKGNMMKK